MITWSRSEPGWARWRSRWRRPARVTAVEVDAGLTAVLRETLPASVEVIHADARRLDWAAVLGGEQAVLVANLPYNIATRSSPTCSTTCRRSPGCW